MKKFPFAILLPLIFFAFQSKAQNDTCTGTLQNNKPQGLWECRTSAGQLKSQVNYNEGVLEGSKKDYYDNGQLRSEAVFSSNKLNGTYKEYYDNAQLKYEGNFVNGSPKGIHKRYNASGTLEEQKDFGE